MKCSHLGFWSGNLFLIAPFPDRCLLVPFCHFLWLNNLVLCSTCLETNDCFSHDFAQLLVIVSNDIQVTPKIIYENNVAY